ncbi:hypothetical protein NDU88_003075 [Pleurodeles waltl]|uniref:Uncharacterized protein n=1 Tax=Pleurodeles waltl TaxID=8319 RepID=A0AAV7T3N1_PLEWA|nr:hypothetical protein NDU88_003075 [Pleurodeles waltl]
MPPAAGCRAPPWRLPLLSGDATVLRASELCLFSHRGDTPRCLPFSVGHPADQQGGSFPNLTPAQQCWF